MPTVKAHPAARFYDGVGVNTHLSYTAYKDVDRVLRCLDQLNIAHCRDLNNARDAKQWPVLKRVMNEGYKYCLMMTTDLGSLNEQLRVFADDPSGLSLLEGSNEDDISGHHRYDGNPDRRQPGDSGPGFPTGTRLWTQHLWERAKGNSALLHLGIVGPSLARGSSYPKLGDLSKWCNYGNSHSYFSNGDHPGKTREYNKNELKFIAPGRPLVATEAGYHTATGVTAGNLGVTPEVHGIYMSRFLFEQYQHGWYRTYIYELLNKQTERIGYREDNWGLFYSDGRPKPAAKAIGAILGLLKDPGAALNHSTGSLDYSLSGMPGTGNSLLFQKKNGVFYLVLWNEVQNWTVGKGGYRVPDVPVTLSIGTPVKAARYYRPAVDGTSASTLDADAKSWRLGLPDSPLVVELVPQTVAFDPGPFVPETPVDTGPADSYAPDDTSNPGPGAPNNPGPSKPPPVIEPPPAPEVPKMGDGSNSIVVVAAGDSFRGPARMKIAVDQHVIFDGDITAENQNGERQTVSLVSPVSLNGKSVGVSFTNDLYEKGVGDRTLWLHSVKIRGVEVLGLLHKMHSNGTKMFAAPDNPNGAPGPTQPLPPTEPNPPEQPINPPPMQFGAKSVSLKFESSDGKVFAVLTVDGQVVTRILMQQPA